MPRRISDYPDAFAGWNLISSFGSIISVVATWLFLYILYAQLVQGKATSRYPWLTPQFYSDSLQTLLNRAYNGLEWSLNSPPKPHAFVSLPLQSRFRSLFFSGDKFKSSLKSKFTLRRLITTIVCVIVVWCLKSGCIYLFHLDINVFWGHLSVGVVSAALSSLIHSYIDCLDFNTSKMMASGSGAGEEGESGWGINDAPAGGASTEGGAAHLLGGAGPNYNYAYPIFNCLGSNQPHARILADSLEHNHSYSRRALTRNMLNPSGHRFLADYLEAYHTDLYKAYIENTASIHKRGPAYNKVKITLTLINDIRKLD